MPQLQLASYTKQVLNWPRVGRHILAQFDADKIVVYQAYNPRIGKFAAEHKYFGGEFSLNRMSWIKTNFLWMMYRSGWGTKTDQEVTLAIWLRRNAFDDIFHAAVPSTFDAKQYATFEDWKSALAHSDVRLQWDPDHHPYGNKLERRAVQLGLRGNTLRRYARDWIVDIQDVSAFVAEQREYVIRKRLDALITPLEVVYKLGERL